MNIYQPNYSALQRELAPQEPTYTAERRELTSLSVPDLLTHIDELLRKSDEPRCPWQMLNAVERLKKDL